MTGSSTRFLVLSLRLSPHASVLPGTRRIIIATHDGRSLQRRGPSIEHKHRFDPVEQQLAYAAQETDEVGVHETSAFLVTHCSLELVEPDARVNGHSLAFHGFEAATQSQVRGWPPK